MTIMVTPAKLSLKLPANPSNIYDTVEFRTIIEDFLEDLKNSASTRRESVQPNIAYLWRFDWRGLLKEMGVPDDLHWVTIRMNGGLSYTDVPKDIAILLIPDGGFITNLATVARSKKRK